MKIRWSKIRIKTLPQSLSQIPAGRVRYMGLMHMVTARSAKIGTRTFAVAVLEAMFVMDTENIDGQTFPG